jgi:glycosyltransferase involved in cell wall biosynthesis
MSLTVAISTHGGYQRYLQQSVDSALAVADEVVVYDDGGECEPPAGARYVALPKTGYCILARQRAIEEASCDYILHLDADDWLISRPPEVGDMAYADLYLCDDSGSIRERWDYSKLPRTREDAWAFMLARVGTKLGRNPLPGKCSFRVAWLREHGLSWYRWPSTSFGEDVRTIIEYLKHEPEIVYTPDSYYVYRVHEGQDTCDIERRDLFMDDMDAYLLQGG